MNGEYLRAADDLGSHKKALLRDEKADLEWAFSRFSLPWAYVVAVEMEMEMTKRTS